MFFERNLSKRSDKGIQKALCHIFTLFFNQTGSHLFTTQKFVNIAYHFLLTMRGFCGKINILGICVGDEGMNCRVTSMYNRVVKRIIDIVCSSMAIVFLSIIYLPICLVIKLTSPGPVFFKQKRVGKNKIFFNILKFRTMRIDTPKDCPTHLLKNPAQYITKVGKFLRKTSLDELPQIFNIFKGDMSVIGPRPALWNQDDLIAERDKYGVNELKPGLTGWAQVNGRDELPISVKAKLDGEYVEKISFIFDVKCLFLTIVSVFKSDGVVEGGTGQMTESEINKKVEETIKL